MKQGQSHVANEVAAHLFGGPRDGDEVRTGRRVHRLVLPEAVYLLSARWSAHFGRPTFVVAGYDRPRVGGGAAAA